MPSGSSTDADVTVAFLDANIILEGLPAAELPWHEVRQDGLIAVLIVPKAMDEIDAKKRDGRLGQHARAFNRLIASSVVNGKPVVLRNANPRVELSVATCSRIPWNEYDDLDPDDGDSRIVAEALNTLSIDHKPRVLISHDIKPLTYATSKGLPIHLASDSWLRPVEPGPKDKEIQRLKQQLAELRKDEPSFDIKVTVSESAPLTIHKVAPLSPNQKKLLTESIIRENQRRVQQRDPFSSTLYSSLYDSSYDERYDDYVSTTIPDFVNVISEKMEMLFNERLLDVTIKNVGKIRADHLVVSIETRDGWINRRMIVCSPKGPLAPRPKTALDNIHHELSAFRNITPARIGRHEIEITKQAEKSVDYEATCEDFRSGQEFFFEGVVVPTTLNEPLEIIIKITASNLRGELEKTFKAEKALVANNIDEIVDIEKLAIIAPFPVQSEMERLIKEQAYEDIEWDNRVDD